MSKSDSMMETYPELADDAGELRGNASVENLDRIARILDDLFRIPILNIRIGLDPILGLIPWLGDTTTALFSIYLMGSAIYYRLPKIIILRMAINVAIDYLLGLIPFVGDATDFFIKSNKWNLKLFRRYAQQRIEPSFFDYLFVIFVIGGLFAMIAGAVALVLYSLNAAGRLW
jgi:hypothetical protein